MEHRLDEFRALRFTQPDRNLAAAEQSLKRSLESAAQAYYWLSDARLDLSPDTEIRSDLVRPTTIEELVDTSHRLVHQVGDVVGGIFGCPLEFEDGTWWDQCTVSLLHISYGNSMGFTATYRCSICGGDPSECPHILGERYAVSVAKKDDGTCSACDKRSCDHDEGQRIEVRATRSIADIDLHEVSFVPRPRDPLARMTGREVDEQRLAQFLGSVPRPGARLLSHECMHFCDGFRTASSAATDGR